MLERGPIQTPIPGLLSLLGLKVDGRGVPNLADTCIPSVEMLEFWLRGTAVVDTTAYTVGIAASVLRNYSNFSTPNPLAVPNGEWWYIHDYSVMVDAGVGTANAVRLATAFVGATVRVTGQGNETVNLAANQAALLTAHDFWLPPGTLIGIYADTITGATGLTATVRNLRFSRLGS